VAVKVLHINGGNLSNEALARFRREAEIATRIGHPNIVEVHDYNTLPSGVPYLVLELLQGESLAARLRYGALPVEEATPIITQVASALEACHQLGVVHRDLKPDNIFLESLPNGVVAKVLDFGISKVVDSKTVQTQDQVLVGTPQYMSPEQAVGLNQEVGPRTDVFALGCIAYEMLTGVAPFAAESVARVVFRIAYEPHVPLKQAKAGLPERIYTAVEGALVKDKNKRLASVSEFVAEWTGQPLPQFSPANARVTDEVSGVATPGMSSNESFAFGATATPALQLPTAPPKKPSMFPKIAIALLFLAGAAGGLRLWENGQPVATPPPGQTQPSVAPAAQKSAPKEPMPVDKTEPSAVAPSPPTDQTPTLEPSNTSEDALGRAPAPVGGKISAAEAETLKEMEARFKEDASLRRVQQLDQNLKSEAAKQKAYVIEGRVACRDQDLANAHSYLGRINDKRERARLIKVCHTLGPPLVP
jgi:serine/threonine-protein kinase